MALAELRDRLIAGHFLAPTLSEGDIVIMDNLPARKVSGVRAAIEATGTTMIFLPPFSPDFNPIEQTFAKIKPSFEKPQRGPSMRWM